MDWTIDDLIAFRENYSPSNVLINNVSWYFYDIGDPKSDQTVVFLHGTTGSKEIFWLQMKALVKEFRIISFDLPPIIGASNLIQGIYKILIDNDVTNIFLVGTSFGGFLAQKFCSFYGSMVSKLVLSNTFITTRVYYQKYDKLLTIERFIPTFILKKAMKRNFLSIDHDSTCEYLIDQLQNHLNKKTLITRLKSFINEEILTPVSIDEVLIVETTNDPLVPKQLQDDLKQAYPNAQIKTFKEEANNFPYLTTSGEYTKLLSEFLKF